MSQDKSETVNKQKKYFPRLELIVFCGGAIGMILELAGSRVLAPYFGNSLYTWTCIIGIILGSLSLGYYWGGKIADRIQSYRILGLIILAAGIFIGLTAFLKEWLLQGILVFLSYEIKTATLVSTFVLFGPASMLLGIVAPYAARLKMKSINKTGSTVGNLYALSTLGSIAGTFAAGFVLIPSIGNTMLLYGCAFSLAIISSLAFFSINRFHLVFIVAMGLMCYLNQIKGWGKLNVLEDYDSQYNRITVDKERGGDGREIIALRTDRTGVQSGVYADDMDELVFEYTKFFRVSNLINPKIKRALMIGGAGFTYPRDFLKENQEATMDVVEIDPAMTNIAKKYFGLKDNERLKIINTDARLFVKESREKYDVIFLDAYSSETIPYHLTTREFMSDLKSRLDDKGFLIINFIGAISGGKSKLLSYEVNTIKSVMPEVEIFAVQQARPEQLQNMMIVAYKNKAEMKKEELKEYYISQIDADSIEGEGKILTDDYAPVEYLSSLW